MLLHGQIVFHSIFRLVVKLYHKLTKRIQLDKNRNNPAATLVQQNLVDVYQSLHRKREREREREKERE